MKKSQLFNGLLLLCIPAYAVFLSLPFVTEVGYEYLRNTAAKAQTELQWVAGELENFHQKYQCYPLVPASHWITEASRTIEDQDIYLIPPGIKNEKAFDPFIADAYTQPYRYYGDGETWFVLACTGPDQDEDLTSEILLHYSNPALPDLTEWMYNPSNGYRSGGDVIVVGPNRGNSSSTSPAPK